MTTRKEYTRAEKVAYIKEKTQKMHETTIARYSNVEWVQDSKNITRLDFLKELMRLGNPYNMDLHYFYSGVNVVVLTLQAMRNHYTTNQWITFKEVKANGWNVAGQHGTTIYIVKPVINGKVVSWDFWEEYAEKNGLDPYNPEDTFCKAWTVFNLDQVDTTTRGNAIPERQYQTIDAEVFLKSFNKYASDTREKFQKIKEVAPDVFEVSSAYDVATTAAGPASTGSTAPAQLSMAL